MPIRQLLQFYTTEPALAAELRMARGLNPNEQITETHVRAHIHSMYPAAGPEILGLAVLRTKLFLLLDEAIDDRSPRKIPRGTRVEIKIALEEAGEALGMDLRGVDFRDNHNYYDFMMRAGALADNTALLEEIINVNVRAQQRSDLKCQNFMTYLNAPVAPAAMIDPVSMLMDGMTGLTHDNEHKRYLLRNNNMARNLENLDFKIFVNNTHVDIELPNKGALTPKLIREKLDLIKSIPDPEGQEGTALGNKLFLKYNEKIRTILLGYQRGVAAERPLHDARLKEALTSMAVEFRMNNFPAYANELLVVVHASPAFVDDKDYGMFKKVRANVPVDELRLPDAELAAKTNAFFDKLKANKDDMAKLLGAKDNLLPRDAIRFLRDNGCTKRAGIVRNLAISECVTALEAGVTPVAKQRFVSSIIRMRQHLKNIQVIDEVDAQVLANGGIVDAEARRLRADESRNLAVEYVKLVAKCNPAHPQSYLNAAAAKNALPALPAATTARLTEISEAMRAIVAQRDPFSIRLAGRVAVPLAADADDATYAERERLQDLSDKVERLLQDIRAFILTIAPGTRPDLAQVEAKTESFLNRNREIQESLNAAARPRPGKE